MGTSIIIRRDFIESGKRIERAIEKGARSGEAKALAARIESGELLLGEAVTFRHGHDFGTLVTGTLTAIEDGFVLVAEKVPPKSIESGLHAIFCPVQKPSRVPVEQNVERVAVAA